MMGTSQRRSGEEGRGGAIAATEGGSTEDISGAGSAPAMAQPRAVSWSGRGSPSHNMAASSRVQLAGGAASTAAQTTSTEIVVQDLEPTEQT